MSVAPELIFALRTVIDPELGINIIDLGLVREARREGPRVDVRMTMTTPACPMGTYFEEQVAEAVTAMMPSVDDVHVELSFDPPWTPDSMTDEARSILGL